MIRALAIPAVSVLLLIGILAPALARGAELPTIVTCSGALDAKATNDKDKSGLKACTVCDIAKVAQNVLNTGIYVAVFLSAILFAWAGFLYLTNVTSPNQVQKAKTLFGDVLVGLLIILSAWLIIDTIMKTLIQDDSKFGPWNEICVGGLGDVLSHV